MCMGFMGTEFKGLGKNMPLQLEFYVVQNQWVKTTYKIILPILGFNGQPCLPTNTSQVKLN